MMALNLPEDGSRCWWKVISPMGAYAFNAAGMITVSIQPDSEIRGFMVEQFLWVRLDEPQYKGLYCKIVAQGSGEVVRYLEWLPYKDITEKATYSPIEDCGLNFVCSPHSLKCLTPGRKLNAGEGFRVQAPEAQPVHCAAPSRSILGFPVMYH